MGHSLLSVTVGEASHSHLSALDSDFQNVFSLWAYGWGEDRQHRRPGCG